MASTLLAWQVPTNTSPSATAAKLATSIGHVRVAHQRRQQLAHLIRHHGPPLSCTLTWVMQLPASLHTLATRCDKVPSASSRVAQIPTILTPLSICLSNMLSDQVQFGTPFQQETSIDICQNLFQEGGMQVTMLCDTTNTAVHLQWE